MKSASSRGLCRWEDRRPAQPNSFPRWSRHRFRLRDRAGHRGQEMLGVVGIDLDICKWGSGIDGGGGVGQLAPPSMLFQMPVPPVVMFCPTAVTAA